MTMKTCRICRQEKPLSEFGVNRHIKCGINSLCKPCGAKLTAEHRKRTYVSPPPRVSKKQTLEAFKAKQKEWRENNKESTARRVAAWQKANPEKVRAKTAQYRVRNPDAWSKQYRRDPQLYAIKSVERRAKKLNATPAWANPFFIGEIYRIAKLRSKATGFAWEVDHIVPLQSPIVCGLHVEHNLRVIPRSENKLKGSRHYG